MILDDFVPKAVPPLTQVIHWRQNSAPFGSKFQKQMSRTAAGTITGYNHCPAIVTALVGTGYFITRETNALDADDHGIVVDYTFVPPEKVAAWPPITPCNRRLGRVAYNGGRDYMRRVSEHVTIGGVIKWHSTKWLPTWFVLCREDPI